MQNLFQVFRIANLTQSTLKYFVGLWKISIQQKYRETI